MKLANKARGAVWRSRWSEGLGATGDAKERPCSEHRVGKPLVGLDAGPERSGTAVPEGCRHNRSEEPDALARTSGSGRGPSGNRRATATASRVRLATRFLEQLAAHGIVSLPAKQPRPRGPDRAVALSDRTAPQPPIAADLASLRPLRPLVSLARPRPQARRSVPRGFSAPAQPLPDWSDYLRNSPQQFPDNVTTITPFSPKQCEIQQWCAMRGFLCCPGCR